MMSASYSDGSVVKTAQILLAKFASNEGLVQSAGSSYSATNKSGAAEFSAGGEPGYGTILSGSVERSNVDITAELVDLISAQRNFQANAKAIETTSSLASTLINMRG
jgi:flagellar hook protein FlgE